MPLRHLSRPAERVGRHHTVRFRLAALYGGLYLVSGAVLLTITALLWQSKTTTNVSLPRAAPLQIAAILGVNGPRNVTSAPKFTVVPPAGEVRLSGPRAQVLRRQVRAVGAQLRVYAHLQQTSDLHSLLWFSGLALVIMAVAAVALGWFTAGRILRPLKAITEGAQRISATNLHERLALAGPPDELRALGNTFDALLGRLESAFAAQRRFVANAAHELRTPLATMRAELEVARDKPSGAAPEVAALAGQLETELDDVDRLLEAFLALARAEIDSAEEPTEVALAPLVAGALDAARSRIAAAGLQATEDVPEHTSVRGSPTLLARLVENLVENAVRHNRPGGRIEVRAETVDGSVELVVENDGAELAPEVVAELTQPFRRDGADRTGGEHGVGLGLSIVEAVAHAHGGTVELAPRAGGGLRATVRLPRRGAGAS